MTQDWRARTKLAITVGNLIVAAAVASAAAPGDLQVVTEITVTEVSEQTHGETRVSAPEVVTTSYQGDKAHVAAANGTVTIYDRTADKVYTLYPADKSYSVAPLKKLLDQRAELIGQTPTNLKLKIENNVDLKKDKESAKKTIAGEEAIRYSLSGSVAVRPDFERGMGGGGFPGGGHRGGGRFPGGGRYPGGFPGGGGYLNGSAPGGGPYEGGRPGGGYSRGARRLPSIQVEGEYWIARAPGFTTKTKNPLLPSFLETIPAAAVRSPLNDKLAKTKGFPVASKVTVTTTTPTSQTPSAITTATEVKSTTNVTLDEALFKVPGDYKQVEPRQTPAPAPPAPPPDVRSDLRLQ